MPRKLFKRWSPDPHKVRTTPGLRILGKLLDDPNLFHLNRHSVSVAFFFGIFSSFIPFPGQTFIAAGAAFAFRCNLPITIALIWISNPVTIPFIFYATFQLGLWMLGETQADFVFELSWHWVTNTLPSMWKPLLLGCIVSGLFFGSLGYLLIQWFWRWHVIDRWKKRKLRVRIKRAQAKESALLQRK